jgi:adenylate cyclase class 2
MFEVELKVRADHGTVRERLTDLGADRTAVLTQTDTYYDAPHRDFAETDEALRIRREERLRGPDHQVRRGEWSDEGVASQTYLTYKGPLVEDASKTREEFESGVDDGAALAGALDGIGFEPAATVEKRRERYRVDGFGVTLDAVEGIGEFVEVEREVETESEVPAAREAAIELLERLGLDADDQIRTSYLGLQLEAGADDH